MRPITVFAVALLLDPLVALAKKEADPPKIVMPEAFADGEVARKQVAAREKGLRDLLLAFHRARAADKEGAAAMTGEPLAKKIKVKVASSKPEKVAVTYRPGHAPVLDKLVPRSRSEKPITFRRAPKRPILHLRKVH